MSAAMTAATVRINASMLPAYVGSVVCMAGRQLPSGGVAAGSAGIIELEASDKGRVTVRGAGAAAAAGGADLATSPYLEIIGKVEADHTLTYVDHGCLGNSFDLENYDAMVTLSHNSAYAPLHR